MSTFSNISNIILIFNKASDSIFLYLLWFPYIHAILVFFYFPDFYNSINMKKIITIFQTIIFMKILHTTSGHYFTQSLFNLETFNALEIPSLNVSSGCQKSIDELIKNFPRQNDLLNCKLNFQEELLAPKRSRTVEA